MAQSKAPRNAGRSAATAYGDVIHGGLRKEAGPGESGFGQFHRRAVIGAFTGPC